MQALKSILKRIDGKSYPAYKDLRGSFRFPFFFLYFDHIQGDPFASPSRIRLRVAQSFPKSSMPRETGKWLWQIFSAGLPGNWRGCAGQAGNWSKRACLHRCSRAADSAEDSDCHWRRLCGARLSLGLPASGRRCWAGKLRRCFQELPSLARLLLAENVDLRAVRKHTELVEEGVPAQPAPEAGFGCFSGRRFHSAQGKWGERQTPARRRSPRGARELAVSVELPNRGRIVGSESPWELL